MSTTMTTAKVGGYQHAFLTLSLGSSHKLGTLKLVLYQDTCPRTVHNFVSLLQGTTTSSSSSSSVETSTKACYKGSTFHRIIKGFMAQGGDFERGDGTGGYSVYNNGNKSFPDENFLHSHSRRGMLSMANSGPNTNGSQFFITFRPTPHLDGKHVAFGHVDLQHDDESASVLEALEKVKTTSQNDRPLVPIVISDCGILNAEGITEESSASANNIDVTTNTTSDDATRESRGDNENQDQDEIDLDQEDEEEEHDSSLAAAAAQQQEEEEEEDAVPKTKQQKMQERLRKLKLKMNQSRQLNRREVIREGHRMGSEEAVAKEKKRQSLQDKKKRQEEFNRTHAKATAAAAAAAAEGGGVVAKHMVQQASDSLRKATIKAERAQMNRFDIHDTHNPEGQHRNYARDLKSIRRSNNGNLNNANGNGDDDNAHETYDPLTAMVSSNNNDNENDGNNNNNKEGAHRLAMELKRRSEKKKRAKPEFEAEDVSYINLRNKHFNEKINRTYDKHTAEIRQNLERGTAL